jgi:hypothetical protein
MAEEFRPLNLAQLYQGADASVANAMQTNLLVLQSQRMKQEFDTEDALRSLAKRSTVTDETGQHDVQSRRVHARRVRRRPAEGDGVREVRHRGEEGGAGHRKDEGRDR